MTSLAQILHNIEDHARTLLHLLNEPSTPADITERLKQHMLLEEQENTTRLQELQNSEPATIIQKALDHSYLIQQMMQQDEALSAELERELLDHFIEEHEIWSNEISSSANTRQWTVGPLWPKGG